MVIDSRFRVDAPGRAPVTVAERGAADGVLLLGDAVSCLSALRGSAPVRAGIADGDYSAAVIGVLPPAGPGALTVKQNLHSRVDECVSLAQRLTGLRHIILVIGAPDGLTTRPAGANGALWATCDAVCQTIQAEVEQQVGTYVIVTIILAGHCTDPALLADRILDRVTQHGVTDAATVVSWDEITADSIGEVGLNQFL